MEQQHLAQLVKNTLNLAPGEMERTQFVQIYQVKRLK